jgi:hypothetical protein
VEQAPAHRPAVKAAPLNWAALVICVLGCIVCTVVANRSRGPAVAIQERVITPAQSFNGLPLRYVLVLPGDFLQRPPKSCPAVVAIPPYSIPPEAMETICIELARRGAVCAIPDFFGTNRAESRQHMGEDSLEIMTKDVVAIIRQLRELPFVDPDKIGDCGHSVGGTVAVMAGINERRILGSDDHRLRACVPIGMQAEYFRRPRNVLFLSGLYDEIHSPFNLLTNLTDYGIRVTGPAMNRRDRGRAVPLSNELYGDFAAGTARQVTIIPTTDHFIETFDPFLIRALLDWYARSMDAPQLSAGPLREWRFRVAAFGLIIFAAGLYVTLLGRAAAGLARRLAPHRPEWIILRLQALPLLALLAVLALAAHAAPAVRTVFIDLMLILIPAQELVSHRARGALQRGQDTGAYRLFRSAFCLALALGAATLLSFGLACLPDYFLIPGSAKWYPVFAANMSVLFPLEVWGRMRPWWFAHLNQGLDPRASFYVLAAFALLAPGLIARGLEALAREAVITVRRALEAAAAPGAAGDRGAGALTRAIPRAPAPGAAGDPARAPQPASRLQIALAVILFAALIFISSRRVNEGMLTWETGTYALISILRFAILPFLLAALIIRIPLFRRISLLD